LYAELALTDLATVEKRIERTKKAAKSGDKKYIQELEVLQLLQEALNELRLVSQLDLLAQDRAVLDELFLLTLKPRMFVLNVSEDVLGAANDLLKRIAASEDVDSASLEGELKGIATIAIRAKTEKAEVVAVSARLEAELTELPEEDANEYLESLGLPQLGTDRVIQVGYRLLNLITFLTAGEDEVRAWTVTKGAKAPEAAGKIHSDIERGFIRAEVTRFEDFMECGSFAAATKKGLLRLEGKDYVIQDGDIAHFRFNVGK
jgi:GTP-binding protein YchF